MKASFLEFNFITALQVQYNYTHTNAHKDAESQLTLHLAPGYLMVFYSVFSLLSAPRLNLFFVVLKGFYYN